MTFLGCFFLFAILLLDNFGTLAFAAALIGVGHFCAKQMLDE